MHLAISKKHEDREKRFGEEKGYEEEPLSSYRKTKAVKASQGLDTSRISEAAWGTYEKKGPQRK